MVPTAGGAADVGAGAVNAAAHRRTAAAVKDSVKSFRADARGFTGVFMSGSRFFRVADTGRVGPGRNAKGWNGKNGGRSFSPTRGVARRGRGVSGGRGGRGGGGRPNAGRAGGWRG